VPSLVWRVTIRLCDVTPTVWRTILVRPDTKLAMLHRYVQAAMGWQDHHLYAFTIGGREYGIPSRELDRRVFDARRYALNRLLAETPSRFAYVYDFGDWWRHEIEVEGPQEAEYRKQYPICIDGAEGCPPEDCGGPPGYEEFLKVIDRSWHPRKEEYLTWARSQLYRRSFDPQTATWAMRDVQRGYR
jgi:hypothetical protein